MKMPIHILTLAVALCAGLTSLNAAEPPGPASKAAPKGGRLLEKTEPRAEFVVEKDHSVTIHFYSDDMKPVAATTQVVVVIAEAKDGKARIEFEKRGDALVSKTRLPESDGYNLVVQFRPTADAKPMNLRFKLDLGICGECRRAEYACICGH